ncbi:unnamed protein product [Rhizophagus irregularis]|nr:unnamed protein product [Rhizophagus irregularis]
MEDIMKISDDPRVYSNPENLLPLPFPFLGERKPVERFSIKNKRFLYMGRKAFDNVLNTINEFKYEEGYMDCFIYGTIGYGKSHILATIVCFLLRTGKRVVYLPDCRELARDPEYYIKSALFLTYANDSAKMSEIHSCVTLDEIEEFCKEESEPLYIVVDQMNALDGHNNTEIDETTKQRIVGFLGRIATKHYYIKSSSANNISALHLKLKQTNEKKIELYEGFDKVRLNKCSILKYFALIFFRMRCYNGGLETIPICHQWMKNEKGKSNISPDEIRSFLSFLPGSEKNFEDALDRLKSILIEKIKIPMTNFSDIIKNRKMGSVCILVYFVINKLYEN